MFYGWVGISANDELFILTPSPRHATFSLLIAWLILTKVVSENDCHLQRKKNTLLIDINIFLATFCRQKVAQKPRKAKFAGSSLVVGKTDATHF